VSYTLRGRIESRLAAALLPVAVAAVYSLAVERWWPLELVGVMLAVGLVLDAAAYHRLLPYQPGWLAVPLGALELGLTMALAYALELRAPLLQALALFGIAWVAAQILAHGGFPLAHLTYADDGGELGRAGRALWAAAPVAVAAALGVAWATQPPTVHLSAGVHQGPLVLDRSQRLIGEPGAVVRGGIVITADDVTVKGVSVLGGDVGISVRDSLRVVLEDVSVMGAAQDGIQARLSQVTIRDCSLLAPASNHAQAIDISFAMELPHSHVERCHVSGGFLEGIATHFAMVDLQANRIEGTTLRGIAMTEMSMGTIEGNVVRDALGVAVFCGDWSHCEIEDNAIVGTRPDHESGARSRLGYAIQASYHAHAELDGNTLVGNPRATGTFNYAVISDR
jgi:Right handed beta helix region